MTNKYIYDTLSSGGKKMAVDVRKAIQELIVPELREIRVEIKGLTVEIKRLDERINSLDGKIDSGFARVDEKIDSLRNEMHTEIKRLDEKIDSGFSRLDEKIDISINLRDRISALEGKVSTLSH